LLFRNPLQQGSFSPGTLVHSPAVLEFVTALHATGRTVARVIELDPE
jgi:hypothetical protein